MKTVGIKNLKNSLSRYMRFVKAGERVLITEHNRIIAEIIPAALEDSGFQLINEYLQEQSEYGNLEIAEKKLTLLCEKEEEARDISGLKAIYNETREERM